MTSILLVPIPNLRRQTPEKGLPPTTDNSVQSVRGTVLASGHCVPALTVSAVRCS